VIERGTLKSGAWPLVLLWLAVHAVLLAVILGAKFLFTKTAFILMLVLAGTVFLFAKLRAIPRKLVHGPVI
jgi:hypothetical protein